MSDITVLLYLLTWIMAVIFFLLWRSNRDRAEGLEDDLERMTKAMNYYKQRSFYQIPKSVSLEAARDAPYSRTKTTNRAKSC